MEITAYHSSSVVQTEQPQHRLYLLNLDDDAQQVDLEVVRQATNETVIDDIYEIPEERGAKFSEVAHWDETYEVAVALDSARRRRSRGKPVIVTAVRERVVLAVAVPGSNLVPVISPLSPTYAIRVGQKLLPDPRPISRSKSRRHSSVVNTQNHLPNQLT